jgi:PKD repeat protein
MRRAPGDLLLLSLALFLAALVPACNDDEGGSPSRPSASGGSLSVGISATPTSGRAPLDVAFTSDVHGGEGLYSYFWDFGNGTSSSAPNPRVQFVAGGSYRVTLRVRAGDQEVTSSPIDLRFDSDVRVSCSAQPTEGIGPFSVDFRAAAEGGSASFTYRWDFGDGTSSTEAAPRHTYASPGTFRQVLTVTSGGAAGSCSNVVTVYGAFRVTCRSTKNGGNTVQFHAVPTFCLFNQCSYVWDFGGPGAGSATRTARPLFTYGAPGTYTASLTASTDGVSGSCKSTVTVP